MGGMVLFISEKIYHGGSAAKGLGKTNLVDVRSRFNLGACKGGMTGLTSRRRGPEATLQSEKSASALTGSSPLRIMVAGLRVSPDSADHMPDHDDLQPVHAKMRGLVHWSEDGFRKVRQCSGP